MKKNSDTHFDAIVIGSGMGGLATASILAQVGRKRVLVLERHFKLGGFTHCFRRKKYEWDVGVHYVGEMYEGALTRKMMDLVTQGRVKWHKMGSPFERFVFPEGTFEVPDDEKEFQAKLIERFPEEEQLIRQYFKDLRKAQGWLIRWFISKAYPTPLDKLITLGGRNLVEMTTKEYLDRFKSALLRSILAAQWPDYGSPPSESAFGIHATVSADFFKGGYYPIGGSKELAVHMADAIEENGGCCLVNHEVKSINVVNGVATSVTAEHKGQEIVFTAPMIISNAGPHTTFGKLVDKAHCQPEYEQTQRLKKGTSAVILFVGLNDDPRNHGFDDANYWTYSVMDHDLHTARAVGGADSVNGAFVSFGSLRNPGQTPHTAQVISFLDSSIWDEFRDTEWKKRGDLYEARKEEISQKLLDYAEQFLPGFRSIVDYYELSTPLTVESFTGHKAGMIYGQACDPNRLFRDRWNVKTSVKRLYLTGSDVGTPGVNGALMGAVMAAARLLGPFGMSRIMVRGFTNRYEEVVAAGA